MIYNNILETIGKTPLIKLSSLQKEGRATILAKLESRNPGGSVKDRPALYMIRDAEEKGILKKGGTIIEPTSGNTGIVPAMAGAALGYKVILVMPETMSIERRKLMKAYGAEFILTPGPLGMKGSVDKAVELAESEGYFMPDQFNNPANVKAHVQTTAVEILEDTGGRIDGFTAGVGTAGTVTGVGRVLKPGCPTLKSMRQNRKAPLERRISLQPQDPGIGANFIPGNYDKPLSTRSLISRMRTPLRHPGRSP